MSKPKRNGRRRFQPFYRRACRCCVFVIQGCHACTTLRSLLFISFSSHLGTALMLPVLLYQVLPTPLFACDCIVASSHSLSVKCEVGSVSQSKLCRQGVCCAACLLRVRLSYPVPFAARCARACRGHCAGSESSNELWWFSGCCCFYADADHLVVHAAQHGSRWVYLATS